jgi:hypothetical protein
MLTTYTLFERVGASNRCAQATWLFVDVMSWPLCMLA